MKNQSVIIIVVLLIGLGIGAFGGMQYQKMQAAKNFPAGGGTGQFRGGRGLGANGMNTTLGNIIAANDKSITVQLQDGSSKIVLLSSTTMINKASTGSTSDLTVGTRVAAFGTTNSDGSITASNIQVNPMIRLGGQQASPSPTQAAGSGY